MQLKSILWGLFGGLAFLAVLSISDVAWAQWQWRSNEGRMVFSDRAPPPDIPNSQILKRPGSAMGSLKDEAPLPAGPASAASAPAAPKGKASAATSSDTDKAAEAKKKQLEQQAEATKKAEQEQLKKTKAENCTRAQQAKKDYQSGYRIAKSNAAGEREFLNETQLAAEMKYAQSVIDNNCK
jgi:hypothetical protein